MTIDALIMFAGAFVAILPFLGFPISWDNIFMTATGIIVIALGIIVRRRGLGRNAQHSRSGDSFVEHSPHIASDGHEAV